MTAVVLRFPTADPFARETGEETTRRQCLALLEDSFGRAFADTLGAMHEAETIEQQLGHLALLEQLCAEVAP